MLDLEPATRQMTELLEGVGDDRLTARTPCPDYSLGDLIDHIDGLSLAFTNAATKDFPPGGSQGPSGDASRLGEDWRTRIPGRLTELAQVWTDSDAWEGMTKAGGLDLPAEIAGKVALTELVVHGWDVARASGQEFALDSGTLEACRDHLSGFASSNPGEDSPFGSIVEVPDDAPLLDRVIGLSGRDPAWTPASE